MQTNPSSPARVSTTRYCQRPLTATFARCTHCDTCRARNTQLTRSSGRAFSLLASQAISADLPAKHFHTTHKGRVIVDGQTTSTSMQCLCPACDFMSGKGGDRKRKGYSGSPGVKRGQARYYASFGRSHLVSAPFRRRTAYWRAV